MITSRGEDMVAPSSPEVSAVILTRNRADAPIDGALK
jgi:hypothetical protein